MALHHYLSSDRVRALADGRELPAQAVGAALFADISGFTALTESLALQYGERHGTEAMARPLGEAFDALIAEIERAHGHTVGFAGDALTAWFDAAEDDSAGVPAPVRALQAALAMQAALQRTRESAAGLALKVCVAAGGARRLAVGDPDIQRLDVLAGPAVARVSAAEALAVAGDVLVDAATAQAAQAPVLVWRALPQGESFAVVDPSWAGPSRGPGRQPEPLPVPPIDALRPWVHPFVRDRVSAAGDWFVTDLRPVVALFMRFGALSADLDDVDAHGLDSWVRDVQQLLHAQGGVLLELTLGDKGCYLYAAFGAAVAHEDDACRAARAAQALRQRFADEPRIRGVAIGIASGSMRVGGYGGRTRQSFGAQGDATNAAARLMVLAAPGEILGTARVRAAVAQAFVLQARAPITLKGKADPMPVFALMGAQRARAIRLQEPDFVLPMVGRDAPLAQLVQALDSAAAARGGLVWVQAEAGMGKSRLLAEGIRHALQRGFVGYGGSPPGDGLAQPYGLWRGVCAALLSVDAAAPSRAWARAVEAAVARQVPQRAEAWPLLGAVLGAELPDNAFTQALAPRDRKALLEALLVEAIVGAAHEAREDGGALLLVLEDVHAAEALSWELLAAVVRAAADAPLCLMASLRTGDDRALPAEVLERLSPGDAPVTRIALGGLEPAAAEQLIRAKLAAQYPERGGAVPTALIEQITERAQGNPFYIEELLNHLHDRGFDPRGERAPTALDWPSSLRSLVLGRIDRLPPACQPPLKVASVIGRRFTLDQVAGCLPEQGPRDAVHARLDELAARGLTPALPEEDVPTYLFQHRVTQEVAYDSIAHAGRVPLHRRVAEHLEACDPQLRASRVFELAHHWARAERPDKAWPYLLQAAETAAARHANEEALAHLTQVLAWLPAQAWEVRCTALLRREAVCDLLGRQDQRRADLAELDALAARLAGQPDAADVAQAALLRRRVAQRRTQLALDVGDAATAAACAAQALAVADGPSDEVEAQLLQARALFAAGRAAEARVPLERCQALARAHGLVRGEAAALAQLGLVDWQLGQYDSAQSKMLAALPLFRQVQDLRRELDVLNNLGVVAKARGQFDDAVARYREAQAIARRIGDRSGEAMLLNNISSAALAAGDLHEAARCAEQAAEVWGGQGQRGQQAVAWLNRAEVHRELGQHAAAQALGERALPQLRQGGLRRPEAAALANLGRVALAQGAWVQARSSLDAALALAREIGLRAVEAGTLVGLARLHQRTAEPERAEAMLQAAGACLSELGASAALDEWRIVRAELALADGRHPPDARRTAAREAVEPLVTAWLDAGQAPSAPTLAPAVAVAQVLAACDDPRAEALLAWGRERLRERSARLPDAATRHDFLNLPEHRVLRET